MFEEHAEEWKRDKEKKRKELSVVWRTTTTQLKKFKSASSGSAEIFYVTNLTRKNAICNWY